MPKYFVILLSLFLLFVVALTTTGAYFAYQNTRPTSTIMVTEIVKQKVKPDQATVQLFISQSGTDIKKMNAENDIVTAKVTDYLVTKGITKNKIKTNKNSFEDFNDFSSISSASDKRLTRVESIIDVEFVNLDNNPNAILEETLALGVTNYGQFNYKSKDLKTVCDQLEVEAEKKVVQKANQKVSSLNGTIVKTQLNQTYSTGCDGSFGSAPMYDQKMMSGSMAPELMTGEQEISANASMNVEYR